MLTLRAKKIILKQIQALQNQCDEFSIPLTNELVLGKSIGRTHLVVDGFSATLSALIDDLSFELMEEEMRQRITNFKPRQYDPSRLPPPPMVEKPEPIIRPASDGEIPPELLEGM